MAPNFGQGFPVTGAAALLGEASKTEPVIPPRFGVIRVTLEHPGWLLPLAHPHFRTPQHHPPPFLPQLPSLPADQVHIYATQVLPKKAEMRQPDPERPR